MKQGKEIKNLSFQIHEVKELNNFYFGDSQDYYKVKKANKKFRRLMKQKTKDVEEQGKLLKKSEGEIKELNARNKFLNLQNLKKANESDEAI
jgi:hypothetical protein